MFDERMNERVNGVVGAGTRNFRHRWLKKEAQRERNATIYFLVPHLGKEIKFAKQNRFLSSEMGRGVRGYFVFPSLGSSEDSSAHLVPERALQRVEAVRKEDGRLLSANRLRPTEASAQAHLAFQSV